MTGRFKLDENLALDVETELRIAGHDVKTALQQSLGGGDDNVLLEACRTEGRILVTFDLDFADIRAYPPGQQPGIWVLRPKTQSVGDTRGEQQGGTEDAMAWLEGPP